ncbi:hypothetical protein EVAR_34026_1 [Eumeta japonica]|uniref:Uncharacterized protein n=1 Tax=Eumeta variegata TaxID=151549 RepID=A0A4C1VSC3_EUMVA|nr:hypothetical protein EVAR_34026_1 [Eumeta japonica]
MAERDVISAAFLRGPRRLRAAAPSGVSTGVRTMRPARAAHDLPSLRRPRMIHRPAGARRSREIKKPIEAVCLDRLLSSRLRLRSRSVIENNNSDDTQYFAYLRRWARARSSARRTGGDDDRPIVWSTLGVGLARPYVLATARDEPRNFHG